MIVTSKVVNYELASALLFGIPRTDCHAVAGNGASNDPGGPALLRRRRGHCHLSTSHWAHRPRPANFFSRASKYLGSLERFVPEGLPEPCTHHRGDKLASVDTGGSSESDYGWFIYHENFDRRIALGMVFLVAGAATLGWSGTPSVDGVAGPLLIVALALHGDSWPSAFSELDTGKRFPIAASYIRPPITLLPHASAPVSAE